MKHRNINGVDLDMRKREQDAQLEDGYKARVDHVLIEADKWLSIQMHAIGYKGDKEERDLHRLAFMLHMTYTLVDGLKRRKVKDLANLIGVKEV